ncbi:MAG: hypothetical protein ACFFBD_01685 [Candidatus Hodarchaeota archaeon]
MTRNNKLAKIKSFESKYNVLLINLNSNDLNELENLMEKYALDLAHVPKFPTLANNCSRCRKIATKQRNKNRRCQKHTTLEFFMKASLNYMNFPHHSCLALINMIQQTLVLVHPKILRPHTFILSELGRAVKLKILKQSASFRCSLVCNPFMVPFGDSYKLHDHFLYEHNWNIETPKLVRVLEETTTLPIPILVSIN